MANESLLETLLRELGRLQELAERALAQVSDAAFFAAPGPADNSLAVIVKHVAGNQSSRWRDLLTADGEKPDRDRDGEFVLAPEDTREALMESWREGWRLLFAALEPLGPEDLERTVTIRGEPHTVAQAVQRQLVHYAYHTGQIVFLARHHAGDGWTSLSVPRGASARFNQRPDPYLGRKQRS